jgi:hypothetical protein
VIEIRLALPNASDPFRRAGASRRCKVLFSRDASGAAEQKKQVAVLYALKGSAVGTSEADFVKRKKQRRAAPNKEYENEERRESDSELRLKQEQPVEEACGGGFYWGLWESGKQGVRASAGLDCPRIAVFARVNASWIIGHASLQLPTKPNKVSFRVFFGRQGRRMGSMRTCSHLGRDCSMRLFDEVRRILRHGRSHVRESWKFSSLEDMLNMSGQEKVRRL